MVHFTNVQTQYLSKPSDSNDPSVKRMTDGSEVFSYLWTHFLRHQHLRDWLMRAPPFTAASFSSEQIERGTGFCCNFSVPELWSDMAECFDLGEMFVPDHSYSHFMCGSMVAASSFHKHLVCALGPAAARTPIAIQAYSTISRRMVVDMGSSRSIRIIEFSWMADGALMVIVKILVAPDRRRPFDQAGCTGAFAVFTDVTAAGELPTAPRSLVSFVEAPRCPVCIQTGSLGCYCLNRPCKDAFPLKLDRSSAVYPPRLDHDLTTSGTSYAADTYDNVRVRLGLIRHVAHVKVTAHLVTTQRSVDANGQLVSKYVLGPSRFVIKAVHFRAANALETHTLRQAAAKFRLLRCGALRFAKSMSSKYITSISSRSRTLCINDVGDFVTREEELSIEQASRVLQGTWTNELECDVVGDRNRADALSLITSSDRSVSRSGSASVNGSRGSSSQEDKVIDVALSRPNADDWGQNVTAVGCPGQMNVFSAPSIRLSCPKCDKTFSQQGSLNRHLKNIHERRKIPCEHCPMTFGQMFDLKVSNILKKLINFFTFA